ncbi:MAG: gliding motility-associated C-terminal domain-containing protein, partial [Crocinitomicaceae bacterium]|nr:gliding motility-associated C-terminal domain-containing protein [Crocinitomicaceae bacterium]
GLYFDPSFFPGLAGYQNTVETDFWTNDPTIVSGQNDTLIIIRPNSPGNYSYQYNVVDDFGCEYDTTVTLFVQPLPEIFDTGLGCYMNYQVSGTSSYSGGVWSCADTAIVITTPTMENPSIATSTPGTYTVTYTDNACNNVLTAEIYYPPYAWTETFDSVICEGASILVSANVNNTVNNFVWSTGETTPNITVNTPGNYTVTASNECYTISDVATIGNKICTLSAPNIVSLSSTVGNNMFFVQYDGIAEFYCAIMNRWGNVIYEYTDPAGGWDGKTSGGDLVDEGTYFYIIKATFEEGREITEHGFVQLKY